VVTWPVAFAVAEKVGASGEQLMVSAVAGYEVTSRLNVVATDLDRGFHLTAVCGNFGAAATAAPLLGLTSDQLTHAFGISGGMAAGSSEFRYTGAWTKPLQAGWACHGGIISAELALRGFTGPSTILEGKAGFFRSYVGEGNCDLQSLTANLGRDFEFRDIIYKPFACKGEMHSPLTAAQELLKEHKVDPDQVEKVIVRTRESLVHLGTTPPELRLRPKTTLDAQYSLPYSLAAFLYFGRAFLEEFSEEARNHPGVLDLASRVHCIGDPEMDRRYPQEEPSEVTLRMKNGTEYTASVDFAKGSLGSPLTEEELREKLRILTEGILSKASVDTIIDMASNLEKLHNVSDLIKAIAPVPR
jgi:2-methylcitrate dehydratase PrpD